MRLLAHISVDQEAEQGQEVGQGSTPRDPLPPAKLHLPVIQPKTMPSWRPSVQTHEPVRTF